MSTLKVNKIENTATTDGGVEIDNTGHVQIDGVQMPTAGPLSNRNLIINGAMQVAQRGTSSTSDGFQTVDRFSLTASGTDETPTQAQVDVSSGTTPYSEGFRKAFKITNGNQTSGAGASDRLNIYYQIEAQDIAQSGWDYTSSSSFLTLSYWVKSSVAQNFYGRLYSYDGDDQGYAWETGTLTAGTWTKITKTIPGNSNLTFDNNTGPGLFISFAMFLGTDMTDSGHTLDSWANFSSTSRTPDFTSTWYTTNDATFEITGVQLEVGEMATPFEHRSYGDELARCQRYFYQIDSGAAEDPICMGMAITSHTCSALIHFPVTMRIAPTSMTSTGSAGDYNLRDGANGSGAATGAPSLGDVTEYAAQFGIVRQNGLTAGNAVHVRFNDADGFLNFSAEL